MKKVFMAIGVLLFALVPVQTLAAQPSFVNTTVMPSGAQVTIPENATQVAPHVFALGTTLDQASGKVVQGYAFVTPKDAYHHRPNHDKGKPGGGGGGNTACYAYMAKGAKWRTNEPWLVNPANTQGLGDQFVFDEMTAGVNQWEDAADGTLDGAGVDVFGDGAPTDDALTADTNSTDGTNEVLFGSIDSQGAIAVTIVWGVFNGPPQARELVEWDMVFDQQDFAWTEDGSLNPSAMDFANIAVHEIGHAFGMDHPDDSCSEETMFRFASEGETKKRDLHAGDITGINGLY